jgi:DNA-binding transcriptional LysR family regulator
LRCKGLLYENIALISAPGTLNGLGEEIRLSDIAHLPIVLPSRPHGIRILVDNAVAKAGVKLNVAISGDAFEVLKALVKTGNYHAFIPLSAINEDLMHGTLEARTFFSPTIKRQLVLAMAPDRKNTRAAQSALKIITNEIEKMVKERTWIAEFDLS